MSRGRVGARGAAVRRAGSGCRNAGRAGALLAIVLAGTAAAGAAQVEVLWQGFRGGADAAAWRQYAGRDGSAIPASWTFRGADVVWNYAPGVSVWSSPALAEIDNRVVCFVGSYDHNVYAIDAATGAELWRFATGSGVFSTPAVARIDGKDRVLVGSSDRTLYCIDAVEGTKVWAYEVYEWRQSLGRAFLASPVVISSSKGPSVIQVSWVYDTAPRQVTEMAEVRAFAPENGRLRWKRMFAQSHPTHPVVGEINGRQQIYVGCRDGNLYCLDGEDGSEIWRRTAKMAIDGAPSWVERRGPEKPALVLVGSKFGDVRAFDAESGEPAWSFKTRHWVDATPAIVRGADGADLAVFGSYDGRVYCLEARTGKPRWRYNTNGNVVASAAIVPRDDGFDVYVPSDDDMLHAIDGPRGRPIWRVSPGAFLWAYRGLGETIWASPAAVRIGEVDMLIVPFYNGRIHAYRLDRSREWLPEVGDPAYGRAMLGRIGATMLATVLVAIAFIRMGAPRRRSRP